MAEVREAAGWVGRLAWCVGWLAARAEEQVEYLEGLGVAPSADELGLEFDDVYRPLESLLGDAPELAARLSELDGALGRGGLGWTVEDLRVSADWVEIRGLAVAVLDALGILADGGK